MVPIAAPVRNRVPSVFAGPQRVDVVLAGAFFSLTVVEAMFSTSVTDPALHLALSGGSMIALAWRRRYPIAVACLVVAAILVLNPQGDLSTVLGLVVSSYSIGAETTPPRSYVGLAVVLVPFLAGLAMREPEPSDLAAVLVFIVGPWSVGELVERRSSRLRVAVAEAARLEEQAAVAAEEERTRIARELHDIVSHSISVVAIQTQAVRRRLGPEHAEEAADLEAVERTAREAMAEMRRLFGVLRSPGEDGPLVPQPTMADVPRLVEQIRATGLEVELTTSGDLAALPAGLELTAYRIVQESLTNAVRHANARTASVRIERTARDLLVSVEDDGEGLVAPDGALSGHGLVGLRERVALYGGALSLTPGSRGGLRLSARLPMERS